MPVSFSIARKIASTGPSPPTTSVGNLALPATQAQVHAGNLARAAGDVVGDERPQLGHLPHLLLDQGGDVGVVDLLLLVGQDLELSKTCWICSPASE